MFIWICALSSALASEIRAADEIDLQTFRDEYKSAEQRWLQKFDSLNIDGTLEVWVGEKRQYLDDVNYQSLNGSVLVSKASARRKYKTILPKSGWDFRVDGDEGSLVVSEIRESNVSLRSGSQRGDLVERFVFAPLLSLDGVVVSSVLAEEEGWKVLEIRELPNGNVFVKASHELLKERKFQFSSVTFELAKSYDYGVISYKIMYGFPNEEQSTVLGAIEYMNSGLGIYPSYVEMDELKRRKELFRVSKVSSQVDPGVFTLEYYGFDSPVEAKAGNGWIYLQVIGAVLIVVGTYLKFRKRPTQANPERH